MSNLTDKIYLFTLAKCKKEGLTSIGQVRLMYDAMKMAYYNGDDEFKKAFAEEMEEYFE